ncbi:hypothetical protein FOA43_003872 [Brettanomyces nanus]|uniref:Zn(2)-C6 fungal-type domain-containing protein n=1 Tax=Eeniella nana TaxID=13502 RepID=A0A875S6D5_EENNA|nr:uncharacterized protein FOA43_003872 [Brettanomyces nanus]QPG76483.1 hypothetical protein FOA43_003872 [Brettanomyces nanus]
MSASIASASDNADSFHSDSEPAMKKQKFKRNYLACLNCRTRKVKCDLGDVDNPHGPPCARCKRERKECVFVVNKRGGVKNVRAGRLKKKLADERANTEDKTGSMDSDGTHSGLPISTPRQLLPAPGSGFSMSTLPGAHAHPAGSHVLPMGSTGSLNEKAIPQMLNSKSSTSSADTTVSSIPILARSHGLYDQYGYNLINTPRMHIDTPSAQSSVVTQEQSTRQVPPIKGSNAEQAGIAATDKETSSANQYKSSNGVGTSSSDSSHLYSDQPLTNNATMVFLAHIAGKIAHADQRDRIDGKVMVEQLEADMRERRSNSAVSVTPASPSILTKHSPISAEPSSDSIATELPKESFGHAGDLFPSIREDRLEMPPIQSTLSMRISPTARLSDIEYIGTDGIMTEPEARRLIKLFFTTMHPFFPYIPKELHDPDVLPGYPMLLCAILTVAARYHSFLEGDNTENADSATVSSFARINPPKAGESYPTSKSPDRHLKVHEQLWIYCQRLFSMTVWGESSSRSIGTLLSFLLFTEWNPRAIHFRWSDYANTPEDEPAQHEEYAGLSAMKRSELMSFMLIGTATRLSFLLPDHPLTFLATHVSETHAAIGLNKRSMLAETLAEADVNSPHWGFTNIQKATIELLQFFSLCYGTLYGHHPKFGSLNRYQNLAILDILSPILENWYQKYHRLLKPSKPHAVNFGHQSSKSQDQIDWLALSPKTRKDLANQIQRESLILDYYYTKLYLYSLALSGDTSVSINMANSKKGRNLRLDELVRYSRYVELAYKAAKEVLAVTQRVHRLRLLKFMPVRWVTRIIKSVSFIVKCYLTLTTNTPKPGSDTAKVGAAAGGEQSAILHLSVIPVEEIVSLLQKTAICLRDAAPDELHLCTRYSTILMYLCSQFKSKMRDSRERLVVDYESQIQHREDAEEAQTVKNAELNASVQATQSSDRSKVLHPAATDVSPTSIERSAFHSLGTAVNDGIEGSSSSPFQMHAPPDISLDPEAQANAARINSSDFTNADQEIFDEYFSNTDPSETLFTWFASNNSPGLDFVDQFTKEMEMEFINKGGNNLGKRSTEESNVNQESESNNSTTNN